MFTTAETITICILMFVCILLMMILNYLFVRKNKKQLEKIFIVIFGLIIMWIISAMLQLVCEKKFNINPIVFEYFNYIIGCFVPIGLFLLALAFVRTKITFNAKYLLLLIMPVITLTALWTNDSHHLFYEVYSTNLSETVFGPFFTAYAYYTYALEAVSLFILMRYSIKNSGFFSKQAILIIIGALVPIVTNILGTIQMIPISVYITPLTIAITAICFTLAILRLDLFKGTPIALQRIVDRISDSYLVLNEDNRITDYNRTFVETFGIRNDDKIRGEDFEAFTKRYKFSVDIKKIYSCIEAVKDNNSTKSLRLYDESINKYFNIEISSIIDNNQLLGILILLKDISQHIEDMKNLKENQSILLERERLATLGQMIGGVAHNLKTPIMSISGATEGLEDLVKEYEKSIEDSDVTVEDHHAIAEDMKKWIIKIRSYNNYMSDIITAVKGQAVNMNENQNESFTIEELLSRVNILMKHELKAALVELNEVVQVSKYTKINGNVNSLVQVVNNLISNSIYAYGPADSIQESMASSASFIKGSGSEFGSSKKIGQKITNVSTSRTIDLIIFRKSDNIIISVVDHACGMNEETKNKLFKQMITTKGHNGSGLGLFMSYSTIKGNFQGNMNFESKLGEGTTFNIILPAVNE